MRLWSNNKILLTELVEYDPGERLAYQFVALGMPGELAYWFTAAEEGTRLVQRQSLQPGGWMGLFSPMIGAMFSRMIARRLAGIKAFLERGAAG